MSDLLNTLPWFAVIVSLVVSNSLNNDKIALEKTNERLVNQITRAEAFNDNSKESLAACQAELKGYTNGSK